MDQHDLLLKRFREKREREEREQLEATASSPCHESLSCLKKNIKLVANHIEKLKQRLEQEKKRFNDLKYEMMRSEYAEKNKAFLGESMHEILGGTLECLDMGTVAIVEINLENAGGRENNKYSFYKASIYRGFYMNEGSKKYIYPTTIKEKKSNLSMQDVQEYFNSLEMAWVFVIVELYRDSGQDATTHANQQYPPDQVEIDHGL